jgi:hypothetical protein
MSKIIIHRGLGKYWAIPNKVLQSVSELYGQSLFIVVANTFLIMLFPRYENKGLPCVWSFILLSEQS